MELHSEPTHPILSLRDDVLNFLEAIDAEPGSDINKIGYKFARLLKELHDTYAMEYAIEYIESCYHLSVTHDLESISNHQPE
jgi:hypothetical protein